MDHDQKQLELPGLQPGSSQRLDMPQYKSLLVIIYYDKVVDRSVRRCHSGTDFRIFAKVIPENESSCERSEHCCLLREPLLRTQRVRGLIPGTNCTSSYITRSPNHPVL